MIFILRAMELESYSRNEDLQRGPQTMTWITLILLAVIAWLVSRLIFVVDAYRQDLADLRTQLREGRGEAAGAAAPPNPTPPTGPPSAPVRLNSASKTQLQRLPKVGAVTAQRIIDARPFSDIDALARVQGINRTLFETLRPLVSL